MTAAPPTESSPTRGVHQHRLASGFVIGRHGRAARPSQCHPLVHRTVGSGKSTLANAVNAALFQRGLATYVLDGDNVRHGLCKDRAFPMPTGREHRRIGEVAKLFLDSGVIVLTAFVSPFRADRDKARALVADGDFIEPCAADLSVCESRTSGSLCQGPQRRHQDLLGSPAPTKSLKTPN